MARSAIASGIAFGAPAGVNPLKPTFCPFWIKEAASVAVVQEMRQQQEMKQS
jgi:hypothetical protein